MTEYHLTIEEVNGTWWLCQRGVYEESSVLHGKEFRQLNESYESKEAAIAANPGVEICNWGAPPPAVMSNCPEDWFDPMDAGEAWGEEDY